MTQSGQTGGLLVFSATAEYALRATVYLSRHRGSASTAADVAGATHVPAGYVSKILQALRRHGLVTAQRGMGGGFMLTRQPADISVLDVVRAVDSHIERITRCPMGIGHHDILCPLHHMIDDAIAYVESKFSTTTMADLADPASGVSPLCGDDVVMHTTRGKKER